jgi:hypothetical protein
VVLYQLDVQLDVAGDHRVLIRGRNPAPKSMPCYVRRPTTVSHKAAIKVLVLEEILRRALLRQSRSQGLLWVDQTL